MEILSWIIASISCLGAIANVKKKWWGFVAWIVANTAWIIVDLVTGCYAQAVMFFVYTCISTWGLISWLRGRVKK